MKEDNGSYDHFQPAGWRGVGPSRAGGVGYHAGRPAHSGMQGLQHQIQEISDGFALVGKWGLAAVLPYDDTA
jgi:hypothetical protein